MLVVDDGFCSEVDDGVFPNKPPLPPNEVFPVRLNFGV